MFTVVVKYTTIIFCASYIFLKSIKIKSNARSYLFCLFVSILLGLTAYICKLYLSPFALIPIIALFTVTFSLKFKQQLLQSIWVSIISFGVSYATFTILSIVLCIPFSMWLNMDESATLFVLSLSNGVFQILFTLLLFRSNRIRNGFHFIVTPDSNAMGIFMSFIILIVISAISTINDVDAVYWIPICFLILFAICLLFWRRNQVTQVYLKRAAQKQLEALEIALDESRKNELLLRKDNERLSSIIHKDNKLIPAINLAIMRYSEKFGCNEFDQAIYDLSSNLSALMQERTDAIKVYEEHNCTVMNTGNIAIDAIVSYMAKKACDSSVEFEFCTIDDIGILCRTVPEGTLSTLLADLIENAIIAAKTGDTHKICIKICSKDLQPSICVYDSGAPFDRNVLQNIGYKRVTTHKDEGGSGIGLMSIFDILRKYNASFVLDEYQENSCYTKCVTLCFDKLSCIQINSYRHQELSKIITRHDIIISSNAG